MTWFTDDDDSYTEGSYSDSSDADDEPNNVEDVPWALSLKRKQK